MSGSQIAKCSKPGCDGTLEFSTDAIGRTVERCPKCSARKTVARDAAPAAAPATSKAAVPLACPKCSRTFTLKGWLDRHVKSCDGTVAAPAKPKVAARTAAPSASAENTPAAAAAKVAPVAITFDVIRTSARYVGIPDEQADRLLDLLRFVTTLRLPAGQP